MNRVFVRINASKLFPMQKNVKSFAKMTVINLRSFSESVRMTETEHNDNPEISERRTLTYDELEKARNELLREIKISEKHLIEDRFKAEIRLREEIRNTEER